METLRCLYLMNLSKKVVKMYDELYPKDEGLSTDEKMLIFLIRKNKVPIRPVFTLLYEKYEVKDSNEQV